MKRNELINKIAKHYGFESQSRQLTEEVGELLQAVNKFWRYDLGGGTIPLECAVCRNQRNIIEELADVRIMLDQLAVLLECESMVEIMEMNKLQREWNRICGTTLDTP